MDQLVKQVLGEIWASSTIARDFENITAFGGRRSGTDSEKMAASYLASRIHDITGQPVTREPLKFRNWNSTSSSLRSEKGQTFEVIPLVFSRETPPEGLIAKLVDLGRGGEDDFERCSKEIPGSIVLVSHEYMVGTGHTHRRHKYNLAKRFGARAFLIGNHVPDGGIVGGAAGAGAEDDIPCCGVSFETASALRAQAGGVMRLMIETALEESSAENLFSYAPGKSRQKVVLSAHIDGHSLANSAIDNATGLCCALAVYESLFKLVPELENGLELALFNLEEWGLVGSRVHLERLTEYEHARFVLNINLDSLAGAPNLTALTSGIPELSAFVADTLKSYGLNIAISEPFFGNSDHGNFVRNRIPALRLCAGFDLPDSNMKYILTTNDTPDRVKVEELKYAASIAAILAIHACANIAVPERLTQKRADEIVNSFKYI